MGSFFEKTLEIKVSKEVLNGSKYGSAGSKSFLSDEFNLKLQRHLLEKKEKRWIRPHEKGDHAPINSVLSAAIWCPFCEI